jgi:hypothetical protein
MSSVKFRGLLYQVTLSQVGRITQEGKMKKIVFAVFIIILASCAKKEEYSVENKISNESPENENSYLLGNGNNDIHEITREFEFIVPYLNEATITIIDMTNKDTDLRTRGILQKIHDGFNALIQVTRFFL